MKKLIAFILFVFLSGMAFSQTTVTLQDQCNCEVLSGTDVSAPGATTPAGVDAGDIYVNTTTGTIFYWDGDSWELTAVDTDDQQLQNFSFDTGTNILSLDIEDGNTVTVDLSNLSNTGTDDQQLSLVGNILTLEDGGTVDLTTYLDNTDDQQITDFSLTANILTLTLEDGGTQTVDLSGYVSTDDQTAAEVTYDNSTSGLTATDVQAAIDEVAAGSTDDQTVSTDGTAGNLSIEDGNSITLNVDDADADPTNEYNTGIGFDGANLTITDGGGNQTIDISGVSTDDQTVSTDGTAGNLSIEDGNSITLNVDDADADPTNEYNTGIGFDGSNLTITDGGGNQTIDISGVSTDDQTAAEVSVADAGGNFTATDVEGALAELAAGSTDDQNISGSGLSGTDLTIGIENGTNEVVDLSSLVGTDDQNIESLGVDTGTNILTVGIENGTSQTVDLSHLDDAGTDDQNISGSGLSGTDLTIGIENGTNEVVDLSSLVGTDDQNISGSGLSGTDLTIGIENGTNEVVDLSSLVGTDDQNIESLGVDTGTNILTVGIENGTSQTVDLSHLDDAGTDDQNISGSGLSGTDLTIGIENGTNEVVDLSSLVGTDDQNIESLGVDTGTNILTVGIENGTSQTVDLSHLDDAGTDDQNISGSGLSGTDLTIGIENGTNEVVDLSSLVGTDDQTAAEVSVADAGGNFTATDVEGALAELAAGSTDDQNISGSGLSGTDLTIGIENGTNEVVDLSSLVGTDDQNIESLGVDTGTNILTVGIENGTSQTVDLSHLDDAGTDDQTAAEVSVADAGGNFTATDVEGALAELAAGSTDDQNISGSGLSGTDLTIGIENGTNEVVDLSSLVGTDDQNIESLGVDTGTNILTVGIENGTSQTVDLSHLDDAGTDDQNISGSGLSGTDLTIGIENGTNEVVDLSSLVGTDDQNIESLGVDTGTNILTVGIENGTSQTVDLSHLDDAGTDDQNISGSGLSGTDLTIGIENGTNEVVDLSSLVGTDDQTAAEVSVADAGGNFTATDVEGALAELAAGSTDDQNISGSGLSGTDLTIGIENGTNEVVDLSSLVGTDDQTAAEVSVADAGGNFTATDVEGALAELAAGSTDDQNISGSGLSGTDLTIGIENGTNEVVDLSSLVGTDDQNIESLGVDTGTNILTVGIENGTSQTVDLSHLDDAGTDDQNISGSGLSGTDLTIGIENGTNEVVDLSSLVGTDDQNIESLGVDTGTNILTVGIENGTSQTVDLSHLDDAGTDDQNISGSGLSGTDLTIGIENGTNEVVDLSSLADDDDVSVTNTVSGNRIATISEPGTASVDINETVTSLSQNTSTGVISYTDEDGGAAETANVVSTDANNQISVGSDGGAFLNAPAIYSMGKINGNGTAAAIYQATVSRINEGDYQITFTTALPNANYIIQLSTLDCGGDCPGNTGANYDDPGISYYNQTTTGFRVNIGDSDNGTTQKDDIDLEFMFTVMTIPN